jgi:LuxR family maltose regulon positive regulatory protein
VRVRALHARAADWFEANDGLEEAVTHWLAAGDAGRAGSIVCRAHMTFSPGAGHATLRRWLEMFTDEQILADHALTVTAGFVGPMVGTEQRGLRWMNAALQMRVADDERWPGTDTPVRALHAGLLASLAPGGISQMRQDAEVMVRLTDRADPATRAAAAALMGQACWLAGDAGTAARYLAIAEADGAIAHRLAELAAIAFHVLTLVDADDWAHARHRLAEAMTRLDEAGCGWMPPILPLLVAKIRLTAHDADLSIATDLATVEAMVRHANVPGYSALLARAIVAEALTEAGEVTEAARWVRAGLARLATYPDAGVLGPRFDRLRVRIEERRLVAPLTRAERRVLDLLPSEQSEKEIAAEISVSPDTVHSHVAAIYRKLDAHGRSEAVARARAIGLLDP